jgi:glycine/D-amino acid oxidase-like deaminating enzyme
VLIAGGGIIGSAIACALVARSPRQCAWSISTWPARTLVRAQRGGARATWWQEPNIAAPRHDRIFVGRTRRRVSLRQRGYLWLYDDASLFARARERRALQERLGLRVDLTRAARDRERFPVLDRNLDEIIGATFSPRDGL